MFFSIWDSKALMKEDLVVFSIKFDHSYSFLYTALSKKKFTMSDSATQLNVLQVSAALREHNSPVFCASVTIFSSPDGHCAAVALTGMRPTECRE